MIDPIVSLAFSIHSTPGAYALLLGSGISRSAAIPTGWEIVLDLIRKVAAVKGLDCEPEPEVWYIKQFGEAPDYSKLLHLVSKSPTDRRQWLRSYFEPTLDEQREGKKKPTAAHRAIARMMADGYVRIVITTNFDRLLETALSELGLHAAVVDGPDALKGMLPLAHAERLIVKVHGDYLDTRIRNTTNELDNYAPKMCAFLDRVLDEFGLIVCGWSAEWDTALCRCIERCNTHRFTTYWTTLAGLEKNAAKLATLRRATVLTIRDADSFFTAMADKVAALKDVDVRHPLTARVAVAQSKRLLSDPTGLIRFHDLFESELSTVTTTIASNRFTTDDAAYSAQEYEKRIPAYEATVQVLGPLFACAAYWGDTSHVSLLRKGLERVANCTRTERAGRTVLYGLRLYPATLLLYAAGIAAVAAERQSNLKPLLKVVVREWLSDKGKPASQALIPTTVLAGNVRYPSRHCNSRTLHDATRPILREVVPDEATFTDAFDWFEFILALCCIASNSSEIYVGSFAEREHGRILRLAMEEVAASPITDAIQSGCLPNPWTALRDGYIAKLPNEYLTFRRP